jgi:flagellar biosynthesis/type III secretory pathway protein FliH
MNTLCSGEVAQSPTPPVLALEYKEISAITFALEARLPSASEERLARQIAPRVSLSDEELSERLRQARQEATTLAEERLRKEFDQQLAQERTRLGEAVTLFQQGQNEYFSHVEPEIVQLIVAVARKILHREAQVDRMLLAALAKVAVEGLQQRSHVVLRVTPKLCGDWRQFFAAHLPGTKIEILEDSQLGDCDCVLETDLGMADLGIEAQLKEIERGFFDLLAKRPETR